MPIGKNSLKRVSNNGYSAVKSTAPDMENSVVVTPEEKPAAEPVSTEKAAPVSSKKPAAAKKTEAKTATKKPAAKTAAEKPATKPTAKKPEAKPEGEVKTPTRRGRPPKKRVDEIPTAAETARRVTGAKESFKGYYNIGEEMPIYLL